MNELPSAQFRRTYAKLAEPTIVTVNGHAIGRWIPMGWDAALRDPKFVAALEEGMADVAAGRVTPLREIRGYSTRPFTPVPKRGK